MITIILITKETVSSQGIKTRIKGEDLVKSD